MGQFPRPVFAAQRLEDVFFRKRRTENYKFLVDNGGEVGKNDFEVTGFNGRWKRRTALSLAGMALVLVFLAGCASTQEWEDDNFNRYRKYSQKQSELEKREDDFENHQRNREWRRRPQWKREMEKRMDRVDPPWWKYPMPRLDKL